MKKLLFSILISIIATHNLTAQTIIAQGICGAQGDNLTWVLTSDSVLTISGVGEMRDYSFWLHIISDYEHHFTSNSPFIRDDIRTVVIKEGVTSIGRGAFSGSRSLTTFISYALTPPILTSNVFGGIIDYIAAADNQATFMLLYVPAQSVELYQYYWIGFEVIAMEAKTKQRNFFQRLFGTRRNKL